MVVRSVNNVFPNFEGNVNVTRSTVYYDKNGIVNEQIKVFSGEAETLGSNGQFTIDISMVSYTKIYDIQFTVQNGSFSQANAPLSAQVITVSPTSITGKAFKVTSAGLLTAMQQTPVDEGAKVYVTVRGV